MRFRSSLPLYSLILVFLAGAYAQTIYLRSSGPAAQLITNCTNGTPPVCTTAAPHGLSAGDTVGAWGTATTAGASSLTGYRKVMSSPAPTSTTFALGDLTGTAIVPNANWAAGDNLSTWGYLSSAQWVGKVN